ncbi:large conductance mechanosensitive channel protein MscL [Nocardioides gansuensis]|uniref:Large conductance mechanosensitive channel protein MscL n=1 Tax=Nocardioides gansuensis TaxID=2138300 RepID=A0A2T8F682_9ACTN|nr:MscL family protein [Nocardioides gansuensis]PVG81213.1 large conductance mechanosensitive channel protein MscL [Nocardioides gansuensis]
MSGFKNFLLRGNLVEVAVALIMALSFAAVVSTFVEWLTGLMPESAYFSTEEQSFGAFLNAVVSFVLLATVVYFLIVAPYTRAKERFFPGEAAGPSDTELLTEIRDLLASKGV